jgi:hypothetical protein
LAFAPVLLVVVVLVVAMGALVQRKRYAQLRGQQLGADLQAGGAVLMLVLAGGGGGGGGDV